MWQSGSGYTETHIFLCAIIVQTLLKTHQWTTPLLQGDMFFHYHENTR